MWEEMQEPLGRGCFLVNVLGFTDNSEIYSRNYRAMSSPRLLSGLSSPRVYGGHASYPG